MSSAEERYPGQGTPLATVAGAPVERVDAAPPVAAAAPSTSHSGARGLAWELVQTVLLTLVIFLSVRALIQNFRVEGASMEPTLHTGEYLLINKAAFFHIDGTPFDGLIPTHSEGTIDYPFGGPQRGDVIVFRAPPQPDKDFIKRVIGLPGDTILVRNGQVFVNGQLLDEPYLEFHANYNYPPSLQPLKVPARQYFVLGDNRPNSSDSHLGWTVPVENLVGKAWVSYWPPPSWGALAQPAYGGQ